MVLDRPALECYTIGSDEALVSIQALPVPLVTVRAGAMRRWRLMRGDIHGTTSSAGRVCASRRDELLSPSCLGRCGGV